MKQKHYRLVAGQIVELTPDEAKIIIQAYSTTSRGGLIHTSQYEKDGALHIIMILPSEYKLMMPA